MDLDNVVRGITPTKKFFLGEDFDVHIGITSRGYNYVHGNFDFGDRNEGGVSLLYFAKSFNLVLANSSS